MIYTQASLKIFDCQPEEPDLSKYVHIYWLFIHSTASIIDFNCTHLAATPLPQYPDSNDNNITQHPLRHLSNPPASQGCCLNGKEEIKTYPFTWMSRWNCLLYFSSFISKTKYWSILEQSWMTFVTNSNHWWPPFVKIFEQICICFLMVLLKSTLSETNIISKSVFEDKRQCFIWMVFKQNARDVLDTSSKPSAELSTICIWGK